MTASVKIRTSWTDDNVIIEGVRIYKKLQAFDVSTRPQPLVEVTDGSLFYEDLDVVENQTYFYMLSCFLGEQEVFTECYEVPAFIDVTNSQQFIFQSPFPRNWWDTYFNSETGDFTLSNRPTAGNIGLSTNDLKVLASTAWIDLSDGAKYYYELVVDSEIDNSLNSATEINSMLRIGIAVQGLHTGINSDSSESGVYFSAEGYGKCWMRRLNGTTYEFRGGDLTTYDSGQTTVVDSTCTFNDVIGVLAYKTTATNLRIEYYINGTHIRTVNYTMLSTRKFKPLIIYQLQSGGNASIYMNSPRRMQFKPVDAIAWPI